MKTTTDLQNVLADVVTRVQDAGWMDDRACRDENPELFFPVGEGEAFADQIREAKQVCAGCPVKAQCLQFGMAQSDGIFGGLTAGERREMRAAAKRTAAHTKPRHGERFPAGDYSADEARRLFRALVEELHAAGRGTIRTRDIPPAFYDNVRSRAWVYIQLQKLADSGALIRTSTSGVYAFPGYSTASAIAS